MDIFYPKIEVEFEFKGYQIKIDGKMNLNQVTPFFYVEPHMGKFPLWDPRERGDYVVQSDTGTVNCEAKNPNGETETYAMYIGAVEFHGTDPWKTGGTANPDRSQYLDPFKGQISRIGLPKSRNRLC